jgi:hypothetical protein
MEFFSGVAAGQQVKNFLGEPAVEDGQPVRVGGARVREAVHLMAVDGYDDVMGLGMDQNPSLLLSRERSTYSWMCSVLTGSSTTSRTLKDAYLEGSKSLGLT